MVRLALILLSLFVLSCTEAGLERIPPPVAEDLDNLLRIKGEFCTEPSTEIVFPVKALFILDQSASLQCMDSQNRRFPAINAAVNNLLSTQPNAQIGFVGFSSWAREQGFTRDRDAIANFTDPGAGLGPATDYQGALATALRIIERDILEVGPSERARTRYIVNFVSDGVPEPRCLAGCEDTITDCGDGEDNDGDGLVDAADPDCANINDFAERPDSLYGVCNTTQEIPDDVYVDFNGICPEYNQTPQILQRVQQLMDLKDIYSVGDITLNTTLLFSPQEVVEAICPGASTQFGYDKPFATAIMQAMANTGNGTFRDINLTTQENFFTLDVTSFEADLALTSLVAHNEHSVLEGRSLGVDSDGDGISDQEEIDIQSNRRVVDTDEDNYSDLFELRFRKEGFDPGDPAKPALICDDDRDSDGDGLNDCEEAFLKTSPIQPDTDGDGILDYLELLYGLDPLVDDALNDLDFDGISNIEEIRAGTNPLVPDADRYRAERIGNGITDLGLQDVENPRNGRMEERHCYNFDVRDIPMVVTPIPDQQGLNRILLYTSERPAKVAGVTGDYRVACFEAFYNGPSAKSPESGLIDISNENLERIRALIEFELNELGNCGYFPEETDLSRSQVEEYMEACMPTRIPVAGKLLRREEIRDLLRKNFDGDNIPRLPIRGLELFVPIQNFEEERDCFRLWEIELLSAFIEEASAACAACIEPTEPTEPAEPSDP